MNGNAIIAMTSRVNTAVCRGVCDDEVKNGTNSKREAKFCELDCSVRAVVDDVELLVLVVELLLEEVVLVVVLLVVEEVEDGDLVVVVDEVVDKLVETLEVEDVEDVDDVEDVESTDKRSWVEVTPLPSWFCEATA